MKSLEQLYDDDNFLQTLESLCSKNMLCFDEYRQEVFMHLLSHNYKESELRNIAKKIAMRMRRRQIKETHYSYIENQDLDDEEYPSVLWEDRHVIA